MVSGTFRIPLGPGPLTPPTVLYTVPAGRTLVLTDFDYVFWAIAEPAFTSQITLEDGTGDRRAWTAFLSRDPVWEKRVERRFASGIAFGPGSQVILAQTTTSASGGDECAVSWSGYLTPVTTGAPVVPESAPVHLRAAPNPMRSSTELRFRLPAARNVGLVVYDVAGRRVRTLHRGRLPAGEHRRTWDGRDDGGSPVAAGAYFVRLEAEGVAGTRKVVMRP